MTKPMNFFIAATAILFSIFAVVVIGYISMATGIGPWVELVVALLVLLAARVFCTKKHAHNAVRLIGLTTAAAGISGIAATACGFTIPTLYFLDKTLFISWLSNPIYFSLLIAGMVLIAGMFSLALAQLFGPSLLADPEMPFPIGQMVARVVSAQQSVARALELVAGMGTALLYNGINFFLGFPRAVVVFAGKTWAYFRIPAIAIPLDQFAIFVAIGFIAGEILLVPLFVGLMSQIGIVFPVHKFFFSHLSYENFLFAFGAGLVLQEAVFGFAKLPKAFRGAIKGMKSRVGSENASDEHSFASGSISIMGVGTVLLAMGYFWYFGFSIVSQVYILLFSVICVYQLLLIGGKTGLAPMGRFATFVMLPGILLFKFDAIQATLVALFVSLAGSIAVDSMFGRKMAQQVGISQKEIKKYQMLGLVTAAVVMGIVFWLLIGRFGLGSIELLAQRSQARAFLVTVFNFDYVVLILGMMFGIVLHLLRINTALVFTGLLFPAAQTLMLCVGGLVALLSKDRQRWEPFWSGVFAAGSLWMLLRVFV